MNDHTDLQVIECNRLHSEEAKSRNNENFALWTNNLQDIVHLEPGDKVSIHGAMVSERGAGQSSSIEIKGESLGFKKTFQHIVATPKHIAGSNASEMIVGADTIEAVVTNTEKEIRDDEGNFLMSYYVPANGKNYIDLPRRFWLDESETARYTGVDKQSTGMSLCDPFNQRDTENTSKVDKFAFYDDFYQIYTGSNVEKLSKLKKDNSRFTIMMAEKTFFSASSASANKSSMPPQYLREPEYFTYYPYRELKTVKVPSGFNSPEYIATEITRQLQSVVSQNTFTLRDGEDKVDNADLPGYPIPVTRTTETETYKPFNVASITHEYSSQTQFNSFLNASTNLNDGYEYLKQYHIVGCKRPELYETGRLINRTSAQVISGTLGSHIISATNGSAYVTSLDYDDTAVLDDFRNFILAQEKYPEIWDIFSDTRTPYNANDTINNSRWCHINRYHNASMTHYAGAVANTIFDTATLGWGGYKDFSWNTADIGNNKFIKQCSSVILPFEYDASQKDTYYAKPDNNLGERTYGCFGRNASGKIIIYGTKHNGVNSSLSTLLISASGATTIEEKRKIGFDQHFTAPGMNYVLPCNGYAGVNAFTTTDTYADSLLVNGNTANGAQPYDIDPLTRYRINQLYLGANAPRLNYDGTHFTISDLHTAQNSGNDNRADNPFFTAFARDATSESDVVYVMNPREQYNDLTTARKPYILDVAGSIKNGSAKLSTATFFNTNLEPWRIYDSLTGVMIEDFNLTAEEWRGSLWELLGFSYNQFNSTKNTRLSYVSYDNANDLSILATNAEVNEGDTKIYSQNMYGVPLFSNMLPIGGLFQDNSNNSYLRYYPEIKQKTQSIQIIADNLPTRMIRGYYTIRSNLITDTPFIGGKVNNTTMPIIGIVDKINGDGDFYFQQESSLVFTITKPLRLASLTCSIHDPDGSYARVSEQSTVLFKLEKDRKITYNVAEEIIQEQQQQK